MCIMLSKDCYLHKERPHPGVEWQHLKPPPGLAAPTLYQEPDEQRKQTHLNFQSKVYHGIPSLLDRTANDEHENVVLYTHFFSFHHIAP